jgi:hypothetical protein
MWMATAKHHFSGKEFFRLYPLSKTSLTSESLYVEPLRTEVILYFRANFYHQ